MQKVEPTASGKSQVVDIPPTSPIVVEAHRFSATCPSCGHEQVADYPAGHKPSRVFGPQIETLVTYFHHVHHLSYERLAQVLSEVFGLLKARGLSTTSINAPPSAWNRKPKKFARRLLAAG
ncbi:hypothetical protein HYR99_05150 [Candidatus Poribacteria bacterium]|nr:hypothetical protein [Candidatus Poribacteria bacterium]